MPVITRDYDFSPGTTIVSAQVDSEFDKIYNLLNGSDLINSVAIGGPISNSPSPDPKMYIEGQAVFQSAAAGAVVRIYKVGGTTPAIDLLNSGEIRTLSGNNAAAPSAGLMILNGCLGYRSSNVGNVGSGEDVLWTYTIKAHTFSSAGTKGVILVKDRGYTAVNANNKRIRFKVMATNVVDSTAVAFNNLPYFLDLEIGYDLDGISTLTVTGTFKCGATEVRVNSQVTGFDVTVDNTISLTAEATSDNDVISNLTVINKSAGSSF